MTDSRIEDLVALCRRMLQDDRSLESVMGYLREKAISRGDSVVVIAHALDVSLVEARRLVHSSHTWADVRERDKKKEGQIRELTTTCKRMLQEGRDSDSIIWFLREQTGKKTISMAVMARILDISLGEAKLLVHRSQAWADVRERDERFEEDFVAALEQLADECEE